jgi:hypothetical protein
MEKEDKVGRLRKGRRFHKKVQDDWKRNAKGIIKAEKYCIKPSGKKGRMDIHVEVQDEAKLVSCVEIKSTNWDRMTETSIERKVKKQINQVCDYIESELKKEKDVSPGIIFPKKPKSMQKLNLIETLFEEKGIPVVWMNESIKERGKR